MACRLSCRIRTHPQLLSSSIEQSVFHPGLVTLFSLRLASLIMVSALVRSIYPRLDFFFFCKAPVYESWTLFGLFLLITLPTDPSFFLWIRHIPIIVVAVVAIYLSSTDDSTRHTSYPPPPPHTVCGRSPRARRVASCHVFTHQSTHLPGHKPIYQPLPPTPINPNSKSKTGTTTNIITKEPWMK